MPLLESVYVRVSAGNSAAEASARSADHHARLGDRSRGHPGHHDLTRRVPAEGQVNLLSCDRVGLGGLLPQDRAAGYKKTAGSDTDTADERPAREAGLLQALRHCCPSGASAETTQCSRSGPSPNQTESGRPVKCHDADTGSRLLLLAAGAACSAVARFRDQTESFTRSR